jgi:hypothetical protein
MLRRIDETSNEKAPRGDLQAALRDAIADANEALARITAIRRRLNEQAAGTRSGEGGSTTYSPIAHTRTIPISHARPNF